MRKATFVGGPRDGETFDPRGQLSELRFVPEKPKAAWVGRAEHAIDLLRPTPVHVYERERIDGYPTLSWVYRGLR